MLLVITSLIVCILATHRRYTHTSNVATRDDTRSTDKSSTNVGNNGTVKVRHDHDVKLCWASDQLHGATFFRISCQSISVRSGIDRKQMARVRVVDDHVVVLNARRLVFLSNFTEGVEEKTVTELHDVGLVDASNFLRFKHLN